MSLRIKLLLVLTIFSLACRERTNLFDPGNENFTTPPPVYGINIVGVWLTDPGNYLVGFRFHVVFREASSSSLPIKNIMYRDSYELARATVTLHEGYDSYHVDLYSETILDVGDHIFLELYFGEIAIGEIDFELVADGNGQFFIRGVAEYDTLYVNKSIFR